MLPISSPSQGTPYKPEAQTGALRSILLVLFQGNFHTLPLQALKNLAPGQLTAVLVGQC